ncbi:hypothetical protein ACHAAC_01770 [Aeromicrobium sp. CF4.19]|uniref:hypothetical protein n=1 Tax=Aeromicrobium sp. CF4.19 TaxID=3373082 RepID=UPI003EE6620E
MSAPAQDRAGRVRAVILLVLVLVVIAAVGVLYLQLRQETAEKAAQYERDARVAAPAGFGDAGLELSRGGDAELVVQTDLTCPHCQEFFAEHGDDLAREAEAGRRTVVLQVVEARGGSRTNETALGYLVAAVQDSDVEPLTLYRAVSEAVTGMDDDAPVDEVAGSVRGALSDVGVDVGQEVPTLSRDERRWFAARTYENREGPGSVPAVLVDGEEVDPDEGLAPPSP